MSRVYKVISNEGVGYLSHDYPKETLVELIEEYGISTKLYKPLYTNPMLPILQFIHDNQLEEVYNMYRVVKKAKEDDILQHTYPIGTILIVVADNGDFSKRYIDKAGTRHWVHDYCVESISYNPSWWSRLYKWVVS